MENMLLYKTLTPKLAEASGITVDKYRFMFSYQGKNYDLQQKGTTTIKLSDPLDIWKIETEGLTFEKTVRISYPNLLKGKCGIVCKDADLGICIIWVNKKLTQTGHILPTSDRINNQERVCKFHHSFEPGHISGDLELSIVFYVKKKAMYVQDDENDLINEDGVSVGEIERTVLDFNSLYMEFPIEEYNSASEPLWWVEFSQWEDPKTIDMFSKDSFCLYLNPYYEGCPVLLTNSNDNSIKNFDILVDILAQTYLLMFQRLSDEDLKATKQNVGLANNSICSILHQFIQSCYEELHWESSEKLLKSLQKNIRMMLREEHE